jgi:tRNA (guanine37-N1)-methyltransferase
MLEAIIRLIPGVVGNAESIVDDSFGDTGATGLLEGPVYTRPPVHAGGEVPPVLLSGDHGAIARWRRDEALRRTRDRRPDLLANLVASDRLSDRDRAALEDVGQ